MKSNELILSWYASHNSAAALYYDGKYYVAEVERFINYKNAGLCNYMPARNMQLVYDEITDYLLSKTNKSVVDVYIPGYVNKQYIKPKFFYEKTTSVEHHLAHAACAFFQSPYKEALVITWDGGGDGSFWNFYKAHRDKDFELIGSFQYDLGFAYMILADYLADIKKESLTIGNLVYAGKLMGLCGYGNVREEWLPAFDKFYSTFHYRGSAFLGGAETKYTALTTLMKDIGVNDFDYENSRFSGQLAYDLAATTQKAFEDIFFKHARKYLDEYSNLPLCLSGGCALNVLLNTKLAKERNGEIFIPPNTNDCGIAVGQLLYYLKPENQVDLTYSGLPILDEILLSTYLEDRMYSTIENVTLKDVAKYISQGYIVGFLQGNSEHGARALGNRSILCNPGIKDMKDVLNTKVKNREFFRPFAPLLKLKNMSTYFEDFGANNSRHMTFAATVKDEWKDKLSAIVHVDGTGRLQTVTRWQNEAIYDLLTEFEKVAGHGVLLNTSFNVNGKPILARFSDALQILRETKLDAVYYHDRQIIIFKSGDEKRFKKSQENEGSSRILSETTTNILAFPKDLTELEIEFIPILKKLSKKVERLVIATEQQYSKLLLDLFNNDKNVEIFSVDKSKHHYNNLVQSKTQEGFEQHDRNSTYFYSQFVKLLWVKEILRENIFDTQYHLFIDLSLIDDYNYSIVRDIKNLTQFAKDDSEIINITGLKQFNSIFDNEFLSKKFKELPNFIPYPYLFYGNIESIEWVSTNYEGQWRWYMEQNKIGVPADYLIISYLENKHRYKFLELEKVNNE